MHSHQKQQAVSGYAFNGEQINKVSVEEVNKLFSNYEAKLSGQIVKSAVLGMRDQDMLSEDLESGPFLNSALQRFMCEQYYRFRSSLAPLSVRLIMSRHY